MQSLTLAPARRILPLLLVALCGAFLLGLSGCAAKRGGNVPYEPKGFEPPAAAVAAAETEIVSRIAPYDNLDIKVFQVEDLSGEFQVTGAGTISFPLVGTVQAAGKTAPELAQLIASRLGEKYLRSPNVQVNIKEGEAVERTITVDGSVKEPGAFPIRGQTTLMRAVALAKGISEDGNPRRVLIFRTVNGQKMAGAFDLADIRTAKAEDPAIYPDDVIIVDGSRAQSVFKQLLSTLPIISTIGILRPY